MEESNKVTLAVLEIIMEHCDQSILQKVVFAVYRFLSRTVDQWSLLLHVFTKFKDNDPSSFSLILNMQYVIWTNV